jgi:hypothetical protein
VTAGGHMTMDGQAAQARAEAPSKTNVA